MYPPPPTVRGVRSPLPLPPRSEAGWVGRSPLAGGAPGNRLFAARGVCDPAIVSDGHNYYGHIFGTFSKHRAWGGANHR